MPFPTFQFAVFILALLVLLFVIRGSLARKVLLLGASYVFYMAWNPAFVLLLLITTFVDYLAGHRIHNEDDKKRRKLWLALTLTVNLGLLAYFKYAGFFSASLLYLFKLAGVEIDWSIWQITLPLGISFYTFQTITHSIDIYHRRITPAKNPLDFALFVAFFPRLLAGPIVRASEFLPQLLNPIRLRFEHPAIIMIASGLIKKVVVADNLAPYVNAVFSDPQNFPSLAIILATIAAATQIYCDFAGYSEIAIGIASVLGFTLPINFDRPYFATNPVEFWRKWHITLSFWLRDYIFQPLANRWPYFFRRRWDLKKSVLWGSQLAMLVTFLACGLWHGAGWNFVIWGLFHGIMLACYRPLAQRVKKNRVLNRFARAWVGKVAGWLVCQYLVFAGWILFFIGDTDKLMTALRKFFIFDGSMSLKTPTEISLTLIILVLFGFWAVHIILRFFDFKDRLAKLPVAYLYVFVAVCTVILAIFWPPSSAPFIYVQF